MPKRKAPKLYKNSKSLKILSALANGTLAIGAAVAEVTHQYPSISRLEWRRAHGKSITAPTIDLEAFFSNARERANYRRAVASLHKRRYAKLRKKRGRWILEVTELGKRHLREIEFRTMTIPTPKDWDEQWHIAIFDIPDDLKAQRDIFRDRLKRLGFFPLQKSVFTLPYPCEDELDALIQYLGITEHVTFFATDSLGYQEAKALHYFNLTRD